MSGLSRRDLFLRTAAAGCLTGVPGRSAARVNGEPIHVGSGAGPAPLGAPVEASVPCKAGAVRDAAGLAILSPAGRPVAAQLSPASHWPDGSVRWLATAFEAEDGPGIYTLSEGKDPGGSPMVREENGALRVDTGACAFSVATTGGWFSEPLAWDLLLTRHDGKVFRASAARSPRITAEEYGPVRGSLLVEGSCTAKDGETMFDYIVRITVYRARPEVLLSVTWINVTEPPAQQLRDIRLTFPFHFVPERLVFGCDQGVYDAPWVKGWPVFLLQEDLNRYWAKTLNPDGRVQHLASGGADGRRCPGWLYVAGQKHELGVLVSNFWQEFPNEITVQDSELSVGLWPERAAAALSAKPILPKNPFGDRPYANTKYWPVMPHPYLAFFEAEKKCLDAPQGLAKTQEVVISIAGANGAFERKYWNGSLRPVRGHVDPAWTAASGAAGMIAPREPDRSDDHEQLFDESFGWFERHAEALEAYGKFDYGDFRYFTAGADYLCIPGTKWGEMGEMAREGYWHNNERDTLRGLLLYYLRTGRPEAWDQAHRAARHLFDVDIRHHPRWGMYTHSYGHCYLALGEGGEPDHSWLAGMLLWAEMSGDGAVLDAILRCGDQLLQWRPDFGRTDARSVSVFLHVMCRFYAHAHEKKYLEGARPAADALVRLQNQDGGWPAYLADMTKPRIEGFVEHAMVALADYYALTGDERVRGTLDRAVAHLFPRAADWKPDPGESPLALHALAVLADKTAQAEYARIAQELLEKLHRNLNLSPDPRSRGDLWATWGVNEAAGPKVPGRPPQLLGQTRPLSPSSILAYGQECLVPIRRLPNSKDKSTNS